MQKVEVDLRVDVRPHAEALAPECGDFFSGEHSVRASGSAKTIALGWGVFGSKGLVPVKAAICARVTCTLPFFTVTSGPSKILRLPSWRNLPCGVANSVPWTDRGVLAQELCCCPEQKHFNVDIFVGGLETVPSDEACPVGLAEEHSKSARWGATFPWAAIWMPLPLDSLALDTCCFSPSIGDLGASGTLGGICSKAVEEDMVVGSCG